jgi:hypothetical protein
MAALQGTRGQGVDHRSAWCEQCGSEAQLLWTEGDFSLSTPKAKPRVIQTIDCPKCGQRERYETAKNAE